MSIVYDFGTVLSKTAAQMLNTTWVYGDWISGAVDELAVRVVFTKGGAGTVSIDCRLEIDLSDGSDPVVIVSSSQRETSPTTANSHNIASSLTIALLTPNASHCKRWRLGIYANTAGATTDAVTATARGKDGAQ